MRLLDPPSYTRIRHYFIAALTTVSIWLLAAVAVSGNGPASATPSVSTSAVSARSVSAPSVSAPCAETASGGWSRTAAPDLTAYANPSFPDGDQVIAHAVDPTSPDDLWVASSAAVLVSRDGGCTWQEGIALPVTPTATVPYTRLVHRIEQLVVGRTAEGRQQVLAVGRAFTGEIVVLRSDAGGAPGTWHAHPPTAMTGNLLAVAVAPTDAERVYAVVDRAVLALAEVHVSNDGGRTWHLASSLDAAGTRQAGAIGESVAVVDEADRDRMLMAAGHSGLLQTRDGGRSFTRISELRVGGPLSRRGRRVVALEAGQAVAHVSSDAGATWTTHATGAPGPFHSAGHGAGPDDLLAVRLPEDEPASVWRWEPRAREFRDISPPGSPAVDDPQHDGAGGFVLRTADALWRWRADPAGFDGADPGPAPALPPLVPVPPPPPAPAVLSAPSQLQLTPGTSRTLEARLRVPPRPRDLDLVLLFDTTNSMTGSIDALRREAHRLVADLAAAGNRARFAVAEFQDYPLAPYGTPEVRPYARLRNLGPVGPALRTALASLSTRDDLDVSTSGLTGLFQVATGAGQDGLPRQPQSEDPNIPAGQGMSFTPGATKVVVTFADEPFHDAPGHPGPSLSQTVSALRSQGVAAVGVAVGGRPAGARADLRNVAAGTGAVAQADVPCGARVLRAGEPLVCDVGADDLRIGNDAPAEGLVGAVTALVDAVPAPATASLTAVAPEGLEVSAGPRTLLDLRTGTTAPFVVTVGCIRRLTGTVALVARVAGEVVARHRVEVTCGTQPGTSGPPAPTVSVEGAPDDVRPVGPAPVQAPPGAALAMTPPPPPVVPVPAPAPAPAGAQAPASAPGAQAAAGGATAPGAALAVAPSRQSPGAAAATIDGTDVPLAAVPLGGGALAAVSAAGVWAARRRHTSLPASIHPRRPGDAR